jgi:hypothetical protein
MKSHYRHSTGLLSYDSLFWGGDIHDHTAFLHLSEAALEQLRSKSQILKFQYHELPLAFSALLLIGLGIIDWINSCASRQICLIQQNLLLSCRQVATVMFRSLASSSSSR